MSVLKWPSIVVIALCHFTHPVWAQAESPAPDLPKGRWIEISKTMVGCGAMDDFRAIRQSALKAARAWKRGEELPDYCAALDPGEKYIVDADQSLTSGGRIVRLLHIQCREGCNPRIRTVYVPPERVVGRFMKPTTRPDKFPGDL